MAVSGAPHDISHEEEVRGRSRVEIHEDRPRRESRLWKKIDETSLKDYKYYE